jgi:anti-anti-sigma factor
VEIQAKGSGSLLVLAGEIDLDAAGQLREEAETLAAGSGDVEVDWRNAEIATSSSLRGLRALGTSLSERGRGLRVSSDNRNVHGLLELAGLSSRFPALEPGE